jgi:hypothetical protein
MVFSKEVFSEYEDHSFIHYVSRDPHSSIFYTLDNKLSKINLNY